MDTLTLSSISRGGSHLTAVIQAILENSLCLLKLHRIQALSFLMQNFMYGIRELPACLKYFLLLRSLSAC